MKRQKVYLDNNTLAFLYASFMRNILPKPQGTNVLYEGLGKGCNLYFEEEYLDNLRKAFGNPNATVAFNMMNKLQEMMDTLLAFSMAEECSQLDESSLKTYKFNNE